MNVLPLDLDAHRAVQMLLPWYATNSLDNDEAARVEAHLASCPGCRAELELERRLQAAQPPTTDSGDAERGLSKMRELIRSHPRPAETTPPRWWRWALGMQFALIAGLASVLVVQHMAPQGYRALGAPSAAAPANALVMFKPEATEQQLGSKQSPRNLSNRMRAAAQRRGAERRLRLLNSVRLLTTP